MLEQRTKAPRFKLKNQSGENISLGDFEGQKVLLWFYPKASTPGWTLQGQILRDEYEIYQKKNVIILGISADSVKAQNNFSSKNNFLYHLLSDPEKSVIRLYEAIGTKKMYGREYEGIFRISYLIDEKGFIEQSYDKVKPKLHSKEILEYLS